MSDSIQGSDLTISMVLTAITRLEDKIDFRLVEMSQKIDALSDRHGDLASRVASLETITLSTEREANRNHEAAGVLVKRINATDDRVGSRLSTIERFQARVGVYLAIAAFSGATAVGIVLKILKLG